MIQRFRVQASKLFSWYQLSAFLLFLLVSMLLVYSVTRLDRGLNMDGLRLIMFLAVAFSLLLSLPRRPNPVLLILSSIVSGMMAAFGVVGKLLQPMMDFLQAGSGYLSAFWRSWFTKMGVSPDTILLQEKKDFFYQAVRVLSDRLQDWLNALPDPVYDPVSLNLIWGFLVWIISIWMFWFVIKKKMVLVGFLPTLLVIAGIYRTNGTGIYALLFVLGTGLLLSMLAKQAQLEDHWYQRGLNYSDMIRKITTQNALLIAAGLVFFAAMISSPKLDEFIKDLRERRQQAAQYVPGEDGVQEASILDEESLIGPESVLEEITEGRLPNVHLVRSTPDLAEIEVMYAAIENPNVPGNPSYYLRSATYEMYKLGGWYTLNKGFELTPAEEAFEIDFTPNQNLIFQEVSFVDGFRQGNLMYYVGELAAANVNYYASFHTKFVNNTFTDLFATVTEAGQYAAYSRTPYFGENELRNTSQEYPDWIANKYLQVPDSVPARVYDLALSLTATQPTPYDRAVSIERYLRQFEYSLEIEDPPEYRDIVDYFLFEQQKGYCDYFASSMVVLARAAGLPARLATGYLASTYDVERDQYIVTADQAHSWAEVYFTDYGWVTFEPTSGRPSLVRPEEREDIPEELAGELDFESPDQATDQGKFSLLPNNLFMLAGQLIFLVSVGLVAFHWIDRWALQAMASGPMFARLYSRLRRMVRRLGVKVRDTDTPLEFSTLLSVFLAQLRMDKSPARWLRSTPQNANLIIMACNQAAYAQEFPDQDQVRQVISVWGRLRWQLLLIRIMIQLMPISTEIRRVWARIQQPA